MAELEIRINALSSGAVRAIGEVERSVNRLKQTAPSVDELRARLDRLSRALDTGRMDQAGRATAGLGREMEAASRQAADASRNFEQVTQKTQQAGAAARDAETGFVQLESVMTKLAAAAAGVVSVRAFLDAVSQADRVYETARAFKIATESMSGLQFAAEQTGADIGDLQQGLRGLSNTIADALSDETGAAAESLKKLGLSARQLADEPLDQAFLDVADALSKVDKGYERTALGTDVLKVRSAALFSLLASGRGGIEELIQKARELGIELSGPAAAGADRFGDALDQMGKSAQTTAASLAQFLAPAVEKIAEKFGQSMRGIQEGFRALQDARALPPFLLEVLIDSKVTGKQELEDLRKLFESLPDKVRIEVELAGAPEDRVRKLQELQRQQRIAALPAAEQDRVRTETQRQVDEFRRQQAGPQGFDPFKNPSIAHDEATARFRADVEEELLSAAEDRVKAEKQVTAVVTQEQQVRDRVKQLLEDIETEKVNQLAQERVATIQANRDRGRALRPEQSEFLFDQAQQAGQVAGPPTRRRALSDLEESAKAAARALEETAAAAQRQRQAFDRAVASGELAGPPSRDVAMQEASEEARRAQAELAKEMERNRLKADDLGDAFRDLGDVAGLLRNRTLESVAAIGQLVARLAELISSASSAGGGGGGIGGLFGAIGGLFGIGGGGERQAQGQDTAGGSEAPRGTPLPATRGTTSAPIVVQVRQPQAQRPVPVSLPPAERPAPVLRPAAAAAPAPEALRPQVPPSPSQPVVVRVQQQPARPLVVQLPPQQAPPPRPAVAQVAQPVERIEPARRTAEVPELPARREAPRPVEPQAQPLVVRVQQQQSRPIIVQLPATQAQRPEAPATPRVAPATPRVAPTPAPVPPARPVVQVQRIEAPRAAAQPQARPVAPVAPARPIAPAAAPIVRPVVRVEAPRAQAARSVPAPAPVARPVVNVEAPRIPPPVEPPAPIVNVEAPEFPREVLRQTPARREPTPAPQRIPDVAASFRRLDDAVRRIGRDLTTAPRRTAAAPIEQPRRVTVAEPTRPTAPRRVVTPTVPERPAAPQRGTSETLTRDLFRPLGRFASDILRAGRSIETGGRTLASGAVEFGRGARAFGPQVAQAMRRSPGLAPLGGTLRTDIRPALGNASRLLGPLAIGATAVTGIGQLLGGLLSRRNDEFRERFAEFQNEFGDQLQRGGPFIARAMSRGGYLESFDTEDDSPLAQSQIPPPPGSRPRVPEDPGPPVGVTFNYQQPAPPLPPRWPFPGDPDQPQPGMGRASTEVTVNVQTLDSKSASEFFTSNEFSESWRFARAVKTR